MDIHCRMTTSMFVLLLAVLASPAAADFVYFDFSPPTGLNLVGAAATDGNRLRLTPATPSLVGGAWATTKQQVASGFDMSFVFEMSGGTGSDGFAFVIQNDSIAALGDAGAQLGFGGVGDGPTGIPNSLAIEFDTYKNGAVYNDPDGNHISVQSRGQLSNSVNHIYSLGEASPATSLNGNGLHYVQVTYVPGTLFVYFDGAATPLIAASVDLASLLNLDQGRAFVGFTAATGNGSQNHDIVGWQFSSVPEPSSWALAVLAAGCFIARKVNRRRRAKTA